MCFIVFEKLKCVTQFSAASAVKTPLHQKAPAFYGAAKIDKLFENQII